MNRIAFVSAVSLLAACRTVPEGYKPGATGAELSVDYFGDTDVIGFHFEVERVACGVGDVFEPFTLEANVDLADNIFPGMVELIEEYVDPDSKHLGADLFVSLEPGCYDIVAVPASAFGPGETDYTPSEDCASASVDGVEVLDGLTTDAPVLISQCVGDPMGGLDTTVLLNKPPIIIITIDEKYNYECETVTACATFWDVNNDPIETAWSVKKVATMGPTDYFHVDIGDAEVVGFEGGHRVWEQCAEITTQYTGEYAVTVKAWDLGIQDGSLVRFEDITGEDSHDSFKFPIYTNWAEEPACIDDSGDVVLAEGVDIDRYPGCRYTSAEEFYCSGAYDHMIDDDIEDLLCDGKDLIEEALYPECE